jgi:hypothetical protein
MKLTLSLLTFSLVLLQACHTADVAPAKPRLKSATSYIQKGTGYEELDKTVYEYDNSLLVRSTYASYDIVTHTFVPISKTEYHHSGGRLADMQQQLLGNSHTQATQYEYLNNAVSKIIVSGDVSTTITVSYKGDTVEAYYSLSNGRFFTYKFNSATGNVQYEKTIDDSNRLSSEVTHDFDDKINPYSLLGFVDPYFTNYSKNNKVKTSSNYYTSAFPTSVPVSYEYEYDSRNLPVIRYTTYVSYPNGGTSAKLKVVFEYE